LLVLQDCWPLLRTRLVPLYAAILHTGFIPPAWRDATAVVLKKPKKSDYSNPKAYRLIAFERCVAKGIEAIAAKRFAYLAEVHGLLPPEHAGGRRGRSAQDVVACVVDTIKRQFRSGHVVVGVALDVAKAFPSVWVEKLVADLQDMGFPPEARRFVRSFMEERWCRLHFEGTVSELLAWESGLPQGSPLSPILFILYSPALLRIASSPRSTAFGWIDDVNILAWGPSVPDAVAAVQTLLPQLEAWSDSHRSAFEPDKTFVTIFHPPQRRLPVNPPHAVLRGEALTFSPSLTLLGTKLDFTLSFSGHQARCAAKAATALSGVRLLSKAKAGLKPTFVRQLVRAVVEPRLTWMGEIWGEKGVSAASRAVWKDAARAVCGGYRSTSAAAMEVEANLPPLDLLLRSLSFRFALRSLSAPPAHLLHDPCRLARPARRLRHPSPLYNALHSFPALLPPSLSIEPLLPWPVPPWLPSPHYSTSIAPNREEALTALPELLSSLPPAALVGFSDGSLIDDFAGAASALWVKDTGEAAHTTLRVLGGQQTVWAGEAEGARLIILSALPLLQLHHSPSLTLLIDNQAFLLAPTDPSPTPGQHLRLQLRALPHLNDANPSVAVRLVWCPGHEGVKGNELVDLLAKEAAEEGSRRAEVVMTRRGRAAHRG
ncbi:hypothetical protein JCM11251_006753, partial [Rhodosporidiobolus azoricus]